MAQPISVSEALNKAKAVLETVPTLTVIGEVTSFRGPTNRGHCYFQIKDGLCSMNVVVWASIYRSLPVPLEDGLEIVVRGKFSIYPNRGSFDFIVSQVALRGDGLLRQKVRLLKAKLDAEGLTSPSRKRRVPVFCERVAVVTSLTGSVIEDVKRTLADRNPLVAIDVFGTMVQGVDAPECIVNALEKAAASKPDAILLVRGGGSYEDLMTFNDEHVARAIAACPVPVVTGIGHEPDVTIADDVADRRELTPTAAAASVAPSLGQLTDKIDERDGRLCRAMNLMLERASVRQDDQAHNLDRAIDRFLATIEARINSWAAKPVLVAPQGLVQVQKSQVDVLSHSFEVAAQAYFHKTRESVSRQATELDRSSVNLVSQFATPCTSLATRLQLVEKTLFVGYEAFLRQAQASLDALSPERVLERGYAIVQDTQGHVIEDPMTVLPGAAINVQMARGQIGAQVVSVMPVTEGQPEEE